MRLVVLLLVVACTRPVPSSTPSTYANLVLENGRIFTGDPLHPWTDAVAILGDRIIAIGADARRLEPTTRMDLGGKLVIPGINDAHVHAPVLFDAHEVDGTESDSTPTTLAAIERATHEVPAGTWLHAVLGEPSLDRRDLTRDALDKVAPDHPVWVDNSTGHVVVLNRAAEQRLALGPLPPGAFVDQPGWYSEYGRYLAMRKRAAGITDAQIANAVRAFEADAIARGITTVQTFPLDVDAERLARVLSASPRRLRWHVMRVPIGAVITPPKPTSPDPAAHVVLAGTKYFIDGMQVERGAALAAPYADSRTSGDDAPALGRLDWDRADIGRMLQAARDSGDVLHLHVVGDRAIAVVLDEMEKLGGDWTHLVVIEHAHLLGDVARAKKLGLAIVATPYHGAHPATNVARLGVERSERWEPLHEIVGAGIPLALGSDGPLDPFANIALAVTHASSPLTREQALVAYTAGSAYDEHLEADKGKLVPGMLADLAVLSRDIVEQDPIEARSVLTIVGGEVVYDAASPASGRSSARTE